MKSILCLLGLIVLCVTAGCATGKNGQGGGGLGESPGYPYRVEPFNQDH